MTKEPPPPEWNRSLRRWRQHDAIWTGAVWAFGMLLGTVSTPPWWTCLLYGLLMTAVLMVTANLTTPKETP